MFQYTSDRLDEGNTMVSQFFSCESISQELFTKMPLPYIGLLKDV